MGQGLYGEMFNWLILKINSALMAKMGALTGASGSKEKHLCIGGFRWHSTCSCSAVFLMCVLVCVVRALFELCRVWELGGPPPPSASCARRRRQQRCVWTFRGLCEDSLRNLVGFC